MYKYAISDTAQVKLGMLSFDCRSFLSVPSVIFVHFSSVDATKESSRLGRLINHSKNGNLQTKLHDIKGTPHLIFLASRDIEVDEELLYDYGDRSKEAIAAHPWLKN